MRDSSLIDFFSFIFASLITVVPIWSSFSSNFLEILAAAISFSCNSLNISSVSPRAVWILFSTFLIRVRNDSKPSAFFSINVSGFALTYGTEQGKQASKLTAKHAE